MDWGGLLGSMALGGAVGYSEGALEEIRRDTMMEERRALMEMEQEFSRDIRQMDIDAEDSRITRTQDFTRGENALNREQSKYLTEGGWAHGERIADKEIAGRESLADKELSGRAGLLRLGDELEGNNYGKKLKAEISALKETGLFTDSQIAQIVSGSKMKGGDDDIKPGDEAKLKKDAYTLATEEILGESMGAPTDEQKKAIDSRAKELFNSWIGEESEDGIDVDAIKAVFSAPDEKTAREAFNALTDAEKAEARRIYNERKQGTPEELVRDKGPLASSHSGIDMSSVRISPPARGKKDKYSGRTWGDVFGDMRANALENKDPFLPRD